VRNGVTANGVESRDTTYGFSPSLYLKLE